MRDTFATSLPLDPAQARNLADQLSAVLSHQSTLAGAGIRSPMGLSEDEMFEQLSKFRVWFDPTAKGERLRAEFAKLEAVGRGGGSVPDEAVIDLGGSRRLLTPEGYVLLWLLSRAKPGDTVDFEQSDVDVATAALLTLYRGWSRRRLDDVVGLLGSETSTLRPAAAGLLLTLLINRNTAQERALTRPRDPEALRHVAAAIASPALAYATALGGRASSPSSVDLYRGWALGELRRRLGPGFHSKLADGIWLDESTAELAEQRLIDDVLRRDARGRARVAPALDAACGAYEHERPKLAALNLAFEQPGNTLRLRRKLEMAAATRTGDC